MSTKLSKERKAVFDEMTPALQKVAKELDKQMDREARGNLLLNYDQGLMIRQVIEDEAEYGSNAVEQLAQFHGRNASELYDLRNITLTWTREEVEEIASETMESGRRLTVMHLRLLNTLKNKRTRDAMQNRVLKESMSARDLANEVKASGGDRHTHHGQGGRKPSAPKSPLAGVQQIIKAAKGFTNRKEVWEPSVFDELDEIDSDKLTEDVLAQLTEADEVMTAMEQSVMSVHERVRKNKERAERAVQEKQASSETAPAGKTTKKKSSKKKVAKKTTKKKSSKKKTSSKRPQPATA